MGKPKEGSWNDFLSTFAVGERRYVEVDFASRHHMMRTVNTPPSRRPAHMADMTFSVALYTAIAAADCGDIRYLLAVDRNS